MKKIVLLIGMCIFLLVGCNQHLYTQEDLIKIYESGSCEFPTYLFNTTGNIGHIRTVICLDLNKPAYYVYGDCDYAKEWFVKKDLPYILYDNVECK